MTVREPVRRNSVVSMIWRCSVRRVSMQVSAPPPVIDVPPPIGGPAWDRELAALGVDRATVERELRLAVAAAVAAGTAEPDGHDVYLNDASPETAAVLVLFHQQRPSYSALMYLRFVWDGSLCAKIS
jgi:hypothetical protein